MPFTKKHMWQLPRFFYALKFLKVRKWIIYLQKFQWMKWSFTNHHPASSSSGRCKENNFPFCCQCAGWNSGFPSPQVGPISLSFIQKKHFQLGGLNHRWHMMALKTRLRPWLRPWAILTWHFVEDARNAARVLNSMYGLLVHMLISSHFFHGFVSSKKNTQWNLCVLKASAEKKTFFFSIL